MSVEPLEEPAGQARRDRVAVHLVWDGMLLAAAIVMAVLVYTRDSSALSGDGLRNQLVAATASLLLATAVAVSLRAAVPNLAVGSIATAAGVLVGVLSTKEQLTLGAATGVTAGAGAAVGLLLGVVVAGLRAPAWAASLAAVALLGAAAVGLSGGSGVLLTEGPDLLRWPWPLFLGAVAISVAGGAVALAPRPRAALGAFRPSGDPAGRRGLRGNSVAITVLVLSSLLATAGGLVAVFRLKAALPGASALETTTLTAVGAALLGGVSVHGRRGGVFGTALAVVTIQLLLLWFALGNYPVWTAQVVAGGAIVTGLVVSRIVEGLGTPREPEPGPPDVDDQDVSPPPWAQPEYETAYYQPDR